MRGLEPGVETFVPKRGLAILEKWHDGEKPIPVLVIYGSRYSRGTRPIHGFNTPMVGYELACSGCDWTQRINGPLTKARPFGRGHARAVHGIRGMESVSI
jgi:hypothetical protein